MTITWLDNSRIAAIFAVVFLHTAAIVVAGADIGSEQWWFGNAYDSFVRWCIPVIVMVSGALLLDPEKQEPMSVFFKKRLSRILIPTLFWSALFLSWGAMKGARKGSPPSWTDLMEKVASGEPYYHMWFLYMILFLYLFTPFFRKAIACCTRREIKIFVVISFLMAASNAAFEALVSGGSRLFINWFLAYIPYFFLGYLVRTDERKISKGVLSIIFLLTSLLTAVGSYLVVTNNTLAMGLYFYGYLSISVIPMSVSVIYLLKTWTKPLVSERFTWTLALLTLGIYLVHPIFLEIIQYSGFGPLDIHPAVSIPVIALIVFFLSLVTAWGIHKVPYLRRII